ncbi:MAG: NCS2 family permease [Candidatus Omnitrophica bacterium]|nr:NCS2 family permease [Candidatus Omnitrophota bacterium]MCM8806639.1 NCS2 family permease [Candidatus Omnitrophota bacterium]
MKKILKYFKFEEKNADLKTEIIAGITTFVTMAYIIFVQPAVLSQGGMDFGAVMVATCLSSAIATLIMGLYANYPIALAPGMGENFYFVFTVILGMGIAWQKVLGAVFISGVLFIILSIWKVREKLVENVPTSLQSGIAGGIGLFITFIGLIQSGIVQKGGVVLTIGNLYQKEVILSIIGLIIIGTLMAWKIKGNILIGMIITAIIGICMGVIKYEGIIGKIPSISPTFLKLDIIGALKSGIFTVIFVFLFMDLFDTVGTAIGIGEAGGFIKDGKFPRVERVLFSDAVGTVVGAVLGTSTVTSYIESAAGVSVGGRTGFASIITAVLFLLSLFFYPFVKMIGTGIPNPSGITLYPVTAPALIVVGSLIIPTIKKIRWEDPTEAIPAFLSFVGIPLTYNIGEGIAFGFISYFFLKLLTGRYKELNPVVVIVAIAFILRFIFLKV